MKLNLYTYFKLLRIKHYIKNLLIFVPLFFNKSIFNMNKLAYTIYGFFSFSLMCSAIYIFNDLKDKEKDQKHPYKKNRPIASGKITVSNAIKISFICIFLSIIINFFTGTIESYFFIIAYLILNISYSSGLKNKPIIDILILTLGFVLRIIYGASIGNITVSGWLYLTVFSAAFFLSLGKRRNEIKKQGNDSLTRTVLQYYNYDFLDRNMYVCIGLVDTFYALWAVNQKNDYLIWTVPLIIIILMKYSLDIEGNSDGDPVEVLIHDKILLIFCCIYTLCMIILLYIM